MHFVREAGLSSALGPGLVARALGDVGANQETATRADYQRALPRLEARLKTYLDPAEAARVTSQLRAWMSNEELA